MNSYPFLSRDIYTHFCMGKYLYDRGLGNSDHDHEVVPVKEQHGWEASMGRGQVTAVFWVALKLFGCHETRSEGNLDLCFQSTDQPCVLVGNLPRASN